MDDILLAKAAIIERCLRRVDAEYQDDPERLEDFTYQDAIVLNLQRACQAAIDMAMHVVARDHLGAPASSAEAFDLLAKAGRIDAELAKRMRGMVGFRNIAVHEYQKLDLAILQAVIEHGGDDFVAFCAAFGLKIL
ncbi:MAG TPA: DUF86 domain-containing protein [Caldilineae bacterium]|nr:DUF86 domain-containing protein [Caldilineae bacterium]